MKAFTPLIGISLLSLGISACTKVCKSYTDFDAAPVILEYFGQYKPGNYWIYENQDGTQTDSIWVSDYKEKSVGVQWDCIRDREYSFWMYSSLSVAQEKLFVEIIGNIKSELSYFRIRKTDIGVYDLILQNAKYDDKTLQKTEMLHGVVYPRGVLFFDTVARSLEYPIDYAPHIGITRYVSFENKDTFYLTKYYIK